MMVRCFGVVVQVGSCQDRGKKRTRKTSLKSQGDEPGHHGSHRQMLAPDQVDCLFECVPWHCSGCGASLCGESLQMRRHQVWEMPPITPVVTEYQLHKLPHDVLGESQFGLRVHAVVSTMRTQARTSFALTQTLCKALFSTEFSTGALSTIDARCADQLEPAHQKLQHALHHSEVAHLDETTWSLCGTRHNLWLWRFEQGSGLLASPRRDQATTRFVKSKRELVERLRSTAQAQTNKKRSGAARESVRHVQSLWTCVSRSVSGATSSAFGCLSDHLNRYHRSMKHSKSLSLIALALMLSCGGEPAKESTSLQLKTTQKNHASLQHEDLAEVISKIRLGDEFMFIYMSSYCGLTKDVLLEINSFGASLHYYVEWDNPGHISQMDQDVRMNYFSPFYGDSPMMFYYKNGRLIDLSSMAIREGGVEEFYRRNGSEGQAPTEELDPSSSGKRAVVFLQSELGYLNLSGMNLSSLELQDKNFEGSDLRNADFRDSNLSVINFSHANLQGANLSEAKSLSHVFWGDCTCPDGTSSRHDDYSCMNHLTPDRVDGISTDAYEPLNRRERFYNLEDRSRKKILF